MATHQGMVRVLGTHFAVQQQAADTLVTVLEGRVALGPATNAEQVFNPLVELRPNQQLSLQEAQQGVHPHAVNAKAALAWRDKQLVVVKTTLGRGVTRPQALLPRCDLSSRPLFGRARNHSCAADRRPRYDSGSTLPNPGAYASVLSRPPLRHPQAADLTPYPPQRLSMLTLRRFVKHCAFLISIPT